MKCLWAKSLRCSLERTLPTYPQPATAPSSACFPWPMSGDQEPVSSLSRLEIGPPVSRINMNLEGSKEGWSQV